MPKIAQDPYLVLHRGVRWTDVYRLRPSDDVILGRSSQNQIVLRSGRASRRHARVFFRDEHWLVEDLGSRNGVWVNQTRIESPHPLADGDQVDVAGFQLRFTKSLARANAITSATPPTAQSAIDDQLTQDEIDFDPESDVDPDIVVRKAFGMLASSAGRESIGADAKNTQSRSPVTADRPLLYLAFALGRAETVDDASEQLLSTLTEIIPDAEFGLYLLRADEFGLLREDDSTGTGKTLQLPPPRFIRQRNGRRYRRPPQSLVDQVTDPNATALLARNIVGDSSLATENTAGQIDVESIMVAPLKLGESSPLLGFAHVLTGPDDPPLIDRDLESLVAAIEIFGQAVDAIVQRHGWQRKLQNSQVIIDRLRKRLAGRVQILGTSPVIRDVQRQIAQVARSKAAVLLRGESGVGKELVTEAIHYASDRQDGPMVCLNCAAISKDLLESELFGHEEGAFTGATRQKQGKFEVANGGTLMLDEIGEMDLSLQAKLLRVLEGFAFERVGGHESVQVDVRIIAATNRDLQAMVAEGTFRQDLFYRLNVIEVNVPPLRERGNDILILAKHFLKTTSEEMSLGVVKLSSSAQKKLLAYSWPGNVRELRNVIQRAVVMLPQSDGIEQESLVDASDLMLTAAKKTSPSTEKSSPHLQTDSITIDDQLSLAELERQYIEHVLKRNSGNKSRSATQLGIERSTLDRKLKRYRSE